MGINFTGCGSGHSVLLMKGADTLYHLPVDQDNDGDSSLTEKQDNKNDIIVAATVMEDITKSRERDSKENN